MWKNYDTSKGNIEGGLSIQRESSVPEKAMKIEDQEARAKAIDDFSRLWVRVMPKFLRGHSSNSMA